MPAEYPLLSESSTTVQGTDRDAKRRCAIAHRIALDPDGNNIDAVWYDPGRTK